MTALDRYELLSKRTRQALGTNKEETFNFIFNYRRQGRVPWLEPALIKQGNIHSILEYDRGFIKGPWPEAEKAIVDSGSPEAVLVYARDFKKGRLPAGESEMLTSANYALRYAEDVIRGPWPAAESIIAKDAYESYAYAKNCLHGRFEAGEHVILSESDPKLCYFYAMYAIKGRWAEAEPTINKNPQIASLYRTMVGAPGEYVKPKAPRYQKYVKKQ